MAIDLTVYLLENKIEDTYNVNPSIIKEFQDWDEACKELVDIAEKNRDRFFYIAGMVKQKDNSIEWQTASW